MFTPNCFTSCDSRTTPPHSGAQSWQAYRDTQLLQAGCNEALLFSPPSFVHRDRIHIIAGKTYAGELGIESLEWLDTRFAVSESQRLIVSPYLDYRQLSNERITRLVELIGRFLPSSRAVGGSSS